MLIEGVLYYCALNDFPDDPLHRNVYAYVQQASIYDISDGMHQLRENMPDIDNLDDLLKFYLYRNE